MSMLAIKGHANRGKEVIEILEMLGGKNQNIVYSGKDTFHYYFIDNETGYIRTKLYTDDCWTKLTCNHFTLEEFLEKFPYKVRDKVLYKYGKTTYFIRKMFWEKDKVLYELSDEVYSDGSSLPDTLIFDVGVTQLKPYKEETMEEIKIDIPAQYPKTYEECCDVISRFAEYDFNKKRELLLNFNKLIKCRDAYWKIAGEQMGLGKPWEPDYTNDDAKFCICCCEYLIADGITYDNNQVFVFPTAEMRGDFLKNFKDLIEKCKELL